MDILPKKGHTMIRMSFLSFVVLCQYLVQPKMKISPLHQHKKWTSHRLANWAMIRNQMLIDERLGPLMEKYDKDF